MIPSTKASTVSSGRGALANQVARQRAHLTMRPCAPTDVASIW
jgi:hypothetical protein